MSLPEQTKAIPPEREAIAPYNFVPLPERIVPAEAICDQDRYHADRLSGRIACRLTTASPLYVRAGWQPEDFVAHGEQSFEKLDPEQKRKRADFFYHGDPDRPVIPGSSLRGMLRALVEIVGYGKVERVTDRPRFFYRAVAAKSDDPLALPYRDQLRNVKAGYITRRDDGWAILPARPIGTDSFIKVRERDIPASIGLVRIHDPNYHLQRIAVSFTHKRTPGGRTVVALVDCPGVHEYAGTLVTSGNMLETGRQGQRTERKNHVVVPEAGDNALPVAIQAVEDYCNGLSSFIVEQLGPSGVLLEGASVFYCEPGRGKREVIAFGHNPNFRLPLHYPGSKHAATPRDFVPEGLRCHADTDLAEAIFGYVRREKVDHDQARAGRVFVSDAELDGTPAQLWLTNDPVTPQILSGPKPTTFQHYLVQTNSQKRELKHYASEETVIRGHKRYWHKPNTPLADMIERDQHKIGRAASQYTSIRPVAPEVSFTFTVRFENLSKVELGALLWVLQLAADERYRLALGMGKPLGMGAVSIHSSVYTSDRRARYSSLLAQNGWETAEQLLAQTEIDAYAAAFETYVLHESGEQAKHLEDALRIRCLLAMLNWGEAPSPQKTRYMEIERELAKGHIPAAQPRNGNQTVNEYAERPVLPLPTVVIGWDKPEPGPGPAAPSHSPAPMKAEPPKPQQDTGSIVLAVGEKFRGVIKGASRVGVKIQHFAHPDIKQVIGLVANEHKSGPFKLDQQRWFEIIGIDQEDATTILWLKPTKKPENS